MFNIWFKHEHAKFNYLQGNQYDRGGWRGAAREMSGFDGRWLVKLVVIGHARTHTHTHTLTQGRALVKHGPLGTIHAGALYVLSMCSPRSTGRY